MRVIALISVVLVLAACGGYTLRFATPGRQFSDDDGRAVAASIADEIVGRGLIPAGEPVQIGRMIVRSQGELVNGSVVSEGIARRLQERNPLLTPPTGEEPAAPTDSRHAWILSGRIERSADDRSAGEQAVAQYRVVVNLDRDGQRVLLDERVVEKRFEPQPRWK